MIFVVSIILSFVNTIASAESKHVTILHFNDIHGHLEPDDGSGVSRGGAARIATIVSDIEQENRARGWETYVLFGGDAFTGTLLSSEFTGAAEFDFLNMLGVDAFVIGNHEYDYGIPRVEELIARAKFPIVSANIYWRSDGRKFVKPTTVLGDSDDVKVVVMGLTTQETSVSTHPSNVTELEFTDPVREAKRRMKRVKKLAPIRIALTHLDIAEDVKLAKKVRGFSAVIGGHDHLLPDDYCRMVRRVPVCETPPYGHYVGRIDFEVDGKRVRYLDSKLIPVTAEVAPDGDVAKMIAGYSKKLGGKYESVIGRSDKELYPSRKRRCELGKIVAEAVKWTGGADVAFVNSGGIRSPLMRGKIRVRDIKKIVPFNNRVVVIKVTGEELIGILNHGLKRGGGSFLQVAGMDFDICNGKACNVRVWHRPVDPKRQYTAATLDFLYDGGDGYTMLKNYPQLTRVDKLIYESVTDYIRSKKVVGR